MSRLFFGAVLAASLAMVDSFTGNTAKYSREISDQAGNTAWVRDSVNEVIGSFAQSMCVDFQSGALIEAVYDNPGRIRINPSTAETGMKTALNIVVPEVPYPSAIVCDGNGVAYVASSASPSAVIAVALARETNGDILERRSRVTALPSACGGVLMMKYSSSNNLLVVTCGKNPASALGIQVDRTDPEEYILTPQNLTVVDGPNGVIPRGLAVYEDRQGSYALVGLTEGTVVKLSLPELTPIERRDIDPKRIANFNIGNNGKTLLMFSPFPWRRLVLMNIDVDLSDSTVTSVALDQDLEFMIDLYSDPSSTTAYAIGNSQRGLPAVLQFDTADPFKTWGIILAGQCNTEEVCVSSGGQDGCQMIYWCEWGPKGRFARSIAFDVRPDHPAMLYIGLANSYCEHCDEWEEDESLFSPFSGGAGRTRCKEGKLQEDYYDNDSYCLQEEWNKRKVAWSGALTSGEMDELSGKAWGGENASVAIMQLGRIPTLGGVSAAEGRRCVLWGAWVCGVGVTLVGLVRTVG